MPTESGEIAVGDTVVFKGAGRDGAHWIVEYIGEMQFAPFRDRVVRLRSGRSNVTRAALLSQLELWNPSYAIVDLAQRTLVAEMVAEGMVEHVAEVLVAMIGAQRYMVEVKLFDITEEAV